MPVLDMSLEAFAAWLCLHEHEVVGRPGTCFHSPLARWLSELSGQVYGVDGQLYGRALWSMCHWLWLPRWAQLFLARSEVSAFRAMTGAQAFLVLANVEVALSVMDSLQQAIE